MAKLDFSQSFFERDLRANIWDLAARFHFETETEFDIAANLMLDICKQFTLSHKFPEIPNTINTTLHENITQISEFLTAPENYISLAYVNQHPQKFINLYSYDTPPLEQLEQDKAVLRASLSNSTEEDVRQAYLVLVLREILDRANSFKNLDPELKSERIKSRAELSQMAKVNLAYIQKKSPPSPEAEASTYTHELARMFGGNTYYQEIIELLSNAQGISNCVDIQGMIDGSYTDHDGIKWAFTLSHEGNTQFGLKLSISNDQPFYPDPQQSTSVVETEQAGLPFYELNFSYGEGNFRVSITALSEIVHRMIRCDTEIVYTYGYVIATQKVNIFNSLLNNFLGQNAS